MRQGNATLSNGIEHDKRMNAVLPELASIDLSLLFADEQIHEVISAMLSGDVDYVVCLALVAVASNKDEEHNVAAAKLEYARVRNKRFEDLLSNFAMSFQETDKLFVVSWSVVTFCIQPRSRGILSSKLWYYCNQHSNLKICCYNLLRTKAGDTPCILLVSRNVACCAAFPAKCQHHLQLLSSCNGTLCFLGRVGNAKTSEEAFSAPFEHRSWIRPSLANGWAIQSKARSRAGNNWRCNRGCLWNGVEGMERSARSSGSWPRNNWSCPRACL